MSFILSRSSDKFTALERYNNVYCLKYQLSIVVPLQKKPVRVLLIE